MRTGKQWLCRARFYRHSPRLTLEPMFSSFPTGLALRNPPKRRGSQDCLSVLAGKPSGYAELLAAAGSRTRSNLPGRKGKELERSLCDGPGASHQHTAQPASTSKRLSLPLGFASFALSLSCWVRPFWKRRNLLLSHFLNAHRITTCSAYCKLNLRNIMDDSSALLLPIF